LTCQLHRKSITYGPTDDFLKGHSEEGWVCKFPHEESSRIGVRYVDIVDAERVLRPSDEIISGQTTLTVSEAIVDDATKMYIPENAHVKVETTTEGQTRSQHYPSTHGKLQALMIRVVDSNLVQPDASLEQLRNNVYGDDFSLKSQMEDCSYNKLEIHPFSDTTEVGTTIEGGVADIQVSYDVSLGEEENGVDLPNAIFAATDSQIGDLNSDVYDLVMFCLPPGGDQANVIAYHIVGTKYTFFGNQWCSSVSALMHEVGHTLGLEHSNALENDKIIVYGDKTGMMGGGSRKEERQKCFNPAKNHQLGWYEDQVRTINPLTYRTDDSSIPEFAINGVSDYGKNSDTLVVLELKQQRVPQDFYIGYNRASGIHAGTPLDPNKITIVRTEAEHGGYGTSTKIASLYLGQSHTILNFNGRPGRDVQVRFVGIFEGTARVQVIDVNRTPDIPPLIHTEDGPCSDFTVVVTTDDYPEDTYWTISENGGQGRIYAKSPVYSAKETTTTTVCLPHRNDSVQYNFHIIDEYGDGLTGNGSYHGFDPSGQEIFAGSVDFSSNEHLFEAIQDTTHTPPPTPKPCRDRRGIFRWSTRIRKKRSCKWIANKNKCDVTLKGKPLWKMCPKACGKCDSIRTRTEKQSRSE